MLHFLGIFTPAHSDRSGAAQKPFFGPEWRLSRLEHETALLAGKLPPIAYEREDRADDQQRFVSLLAPPFS